MTELTKNTKNDWAYLDKFFGMLAEENIRVVRSSNARTASFNTESRVITIPPIALNDKDIFLVMGSHEVAHAIWTPVDWYKVHNSNDNTTTPGTPKTRLIQTCMNIVEDIRIERLIRRRYPGFVAVYNRGYEKLMGVDFFSVDHWNKFKIHDRINAYAKLGNLLPVKLTPKEMCVYKYVQATKSFDDVVARAEFLANMVEAEFCSTPGENVDKSQASDLTDEDISDIIEAMDGQEQITDEMTDIIKEVKDSMGSPSDTDDEGETESNEHEKSKDTNKSEPEPSDDEEETDGESGDGGAGEDTDTPSDRSPDEATDDDYASHVENKLDSEMRSNMANGYLNEYYTPRTINVKSAWGNSSKLSEGESNTKSLLGYL